MANVEEPIEQLLKSDNRLTIFPIQHYVYVGYV